MILLKVVVEPEALCLDEKMAHLLSQKLHRLRNEKNAQVLSGFFKSGKGQYGEGDQFLGVKVPQVRALIRSDRERIDSFTLTEIGKFLQSPWHEERLLGVLILVHRYEQGTEDQKRRVLKGYLAMAQKGFVNNWDLVDQSAPNIAGEWMLKKERGLLDGWVDSKKLWERRIAVVATWRLIRNHDFEKTIEYAERLLGDSHDLMHKACGWMLREIGKRDVTVLNGFLERHTLKMPRTMLRYAIERLPEAKRKEFLMRR